MAQNSIEDVTRINARLKEKLLHWLPEPGLHTTAVEGLRLSNTMDTKFSVRIFEKALAKYSKSDILNTNQGIQFTNATFTGVLQEKGIQISLDGRGQCLDNVCIEMLWPSLTYEDI